MFARCEPSMRPGSLPVRAGHPMQIIESARKRIKKTGLHRAVCDHLAGMTDRYVMKECERIFGGEFKL